jgi:hypothetical protein
MRDGSPLARQGKRSESYRLGWSASELNEFTGNPSSPARRPASSLAAEKPRGANVLEPPMPLKKAADLMSAK